MKALNYLVKHKLLLIPIVIGGLALLWTTIFDGHYGCTSKSCGYIVGTNYNDIFWFLSLVNVSFKTFPFQMPTYTGEILRGYHFLPNLTIHILSLSGIPPDIWFYQVLPIIYVVSLALLIITFGLTYKDKVSYIFFLLFFVFFGTPLAYLVSYIKTKMIDNTLVFTPLYQASRLWESPHFAFSILIFLATLILLNNITGKNWKVPMAISILLFIEVGTKFYGGILLFLTVIVYSMLGLKEKKYFRISLINIAVFTVAVCLGILVFYNPFSVKGSTFVFLPFTTVHHMIEGPKLFYSAKMVNARYFLYEHGFSPRLLLIELWSTFLFIVYYCGLRILGVCYILYSLYKRNISRLDLALTLTVLVSFFIPIAFIQKGEWYNTIQFGTYGAFILGLFSAKFLYQLWNSRNILIKSIIIILLLITIPATLVQFNYLKNSARVVISSGEMEALKYLRFQPDGVVYTPIYNVDGTYVSAYSAKQTYINGVSLLRNSGINYDKRLKQVENMQNINVSALPVRYIYVPTAYEDKDVLLQKLNSSKKYKKIYKNKDATIYLKVSS